MMFCTQCGTENRIDARFCQKCGYALYLSENSSADILAPTNKEFPSSETLSSQTDTIPPIQKIPEERKSDESNTVREVSYNHVINTQTGVAVVRPWVRYWARFIDISIFSFIFTLMLGMVVPNIFNSNLDSYAQNAIAIGLISVFVWVFVEAFWLSSFGTTPGKWLLKIRLSLASGKSIKYSQALVRSFKVWARGYACGFPLVNIITYIVAYIRLNKNGITSWDREENFVVTHEKIGAPRILVIICFFVILLFFIAVMESINRLNFSTVSV
jgi:hypothetical protein